MIKIDDLTISFDDNIVLHNIDLQIEKNRITTIVGKSGSGKSVLMKAIEGLIIPVSGTIEIDGENIFRQNREGLKRIRKKIAMLFQGSALLDSLTVFQNVALPLKEHTRKSSKEIYEIVLKKLELVDLENVMQKMPSELSGGMRKRVALARAIILQPDYIIYDEPTTGLDPVIAQEITELILMLHRQYKITSIIITHDLNCINKVKGHIAMLHEKKIIFDGTYQNFIKADDKMIKEFLA